MNNNFIPKKILYYQSFSVGNNGGVKRSRQIEFFLKNEFGNDVVKLGVKWSVNCLVGLFFLPLVWVKHRKNYLTLKGVIKISLIYAKLKKFKDCKIEAHIETDRNFGMIFGLVCQELGIEYIAYPHNIEFLVPGQTSGPNFKDQTALAKVERFLFENAKIVRVISRFDLAVVQCIGAQGELLRYEPVTEDFEFCRQVKEQRKKRKNKSNDFIMIGSAFNGPTKIAFENCLAEICSELQKINAKLFLVGKGTSDILQGSEIKNIVRLGYVENDELLKILSEVDAAIIPVCQTTGYLTRLTELMASSVPVITVGDYIDVLINDCHTNSIAVQRASQIIEVIEGL